MSDQTDTLLTGVAHAAGIRAKDEGDQGYLLPWGHPTGWPAIPSGAHGRFRSRDDNLLDATTDRDAIASWFAKKRHKSPNTLSAYQREVTRLLLWAADKKGKALSDLSAKDYLEYQSFLADPQPAEKWVASQGQKRSIHHPEWKPFYRGLSPRVQSYAQRVIRQLISYLVESNYLSGNPLATISTDTPASHRAQPQDTRRRALPHQAWEAVKEHIDALPGQSQKERFEKARARWMVMLLYTLGPRISDLRGVFGDIHPMTIHGGAIWVWRITGKGGKSAELPLPDTLVEEMIRFRRTLGLPATPTHDESTPLVPRWAERNRGRPLNRQGLDRIIRTVLQGAARDLELQGDEQGASWLRHASAHSFRHTAATGILEAVGSMRVTAEILRHSDIRTTQQYTKQEILALAQALKKRQVSW